MQYVWEQRLWPVRDMSTVDGRRIVVLDPGVLNHDSGPDFFNAKVIIDGQHWSGNVEIHVKASDWYAHHHDKDKAYDSVVLHVVDVDDASVYRSNGEKIPQMVMKCAPDFSKRYTDMVFNPLRELPCGGEISSLPSIYVTDWLTSLGFERLYTKSDRIMGLLERCNGDWAEVLYVTLARALGFSTNSEPFEMLALSTPLRHMLHYTDSLMSVEAILFGQAGLLTGLDNSPEPYVAALCREYRFLQAKYQLQPSKNIMWKMARMRPQNFPHRRIAALARMICSNALTSNAIIEAKNEDAARRIFNLRLDGFWADHFNFSGASPMVSATAMSNSSITVLLINVVVPMIFAYATSRGDDRRREFAVDLLHKLKPESNRIIETFCRAGLIAHDAFNSQALIQLKRQYCEGRKCLYCRVGHKLLSMKVKRES